MTRRGARDFQRDLRTKESSNCSDNTIGGRQLANLLTIKSNLGLCITKFSPSLNERVIWMQKLEIGLVKYSVKDQHVLRHIVRSKCN